MQDLSGRKLGQYELRERLGRGGMAEVYKSYQSGMDRFVAIKVMLGSLNEDDSFIERFRREARAVGNLRHPHIVQAFDFGIEDGVYYLAMEFVEGGNLKEHIQKRGKLPLRNALQIATQLADALAYAHDKGMVHRDMKPANVMFLDDTLKQAILTDFGIARIMGEAGLTGTGMAVGTPDYMSPEAGMGDETDHRSDIYALGIILYEMLVGDVPYSADTPLAVIMKHINAPLPTRKDYSDAIPEAVEKVILRCMAKAPDDRFQSGHEMKAALDKVIAQLDSTADTAPKSAPALPKTAISEAQDNHPTMLGQLDNPTEALPQTTPSTSGNNNLIMGVGAIAVVALVLVIAFFALNNNPSAPTDPTTAPEVVVNPTEAATDEPIEEPTEPPADEPTIAPTGVATAGSQSNEAATPASGAATIPYDAQLPPHPENLMLTSGIAPVVDAVELALIPENQEAALAAANAILDEEPDNLEALFARAMTYACCWDEEGFGLIDANRIVELYSDSPLGYIAQGHAYLNNPGFDYDLATAAIEQAHAVAPDDIHALWRWAGFSPYDEQMERFDDAEERGARGWHYITLAANILYDSREYERAIPYLYIYSNEELGSESNYWEARWELMGALIQTGQEAAAYEIVQEHADQIQFSDAYANIAYVAYRADDYEQARTWASTAVALNGDEHAARYVLALLEWYQNTDMDAAFEQLTALEDVFINSYYVNLEFGNDVNLDRARILVDDGQLEESLEYYDAIIDFYNYEAWLYEERADVHLELGNTEAARADLENARQITDDDDYRRELLQRIIELGPAPTSTGED